MACKAFDCGVQFAVEKVRGFIWILILCELHEVNPKQNYIKDKISYVMEP